MTLMCLDCERPMVARKDRKPGELGKGRRGCCFTCYEKRVKADDLWGLPGVRGVRDDRAPSWARVEDYLFLRKQGENFDQIAARMGIKPKSLRQALWRAGVSARADS